MDTVQLTEEEMAEVKKEALEKLRPHLCGKITADRHFDYLRAKKILSREDTEEISNQPTNTRRAGKLLDYIAENPKGLDTLIDSIIREKTQIFLIPKITDEVQRCKNDRIMQKGSSILSSYIMSKDESSTNNLSRLSSFEPSIQKRVDANILFHPEGEVSPGASLLYSFPSLSLKSGSTLEKATTMSNMETMPATLSLPRPGEPGAPPLPDELQAESEGTCSNSSDEFLPLRSRSP
ncbi:B-cell lymphoma/leukemia 10-like [Callorhinchus milii]|nr:B-cell lymphoma/leukemia 10 [Callorhinchus milii]XP_042191438.1 B-cell lymphoma/leukemia 10-like [Callorhinchus milii]|eukprot:gi/632940565/ref/XP_007885387.1/ PREDICTED: B-cell lymphoma/leukemia 10 [Callorhinchus milii]